MFARVNQENAIHEQQTATAAKNDGLRGLNPKTPGAKAPKTPFKIPLNDENATFGPGKTGGKGKDGGLFGDGKGGKVEASAFMTPAGPRARAPLGNKTTNAKAGAFRTPGPIQEQPSAKPTSPRIRRGKVKVLQSEETEAKDDSSEREIEHMPPREIPLPDHPDDWPHDRKYPQFEGQNFTRGWWSEFASKPDVEREMNDFDDQVRKLETRDADFRKKAQEKRDSVARAKAVPAKKHPLSDNVPSTVASRQASSALGLRVGAVPSFAASTAATKAKAPQALQSKKTAAGPAAAGNPRHTAARVASNTTLGYSKGRSVSTATRRPLGDIHQKPETRPPPSQTPFGGGTTLDQLLSLSLEDREEDDDDSLGAGKTADLHEEDDSLDDFQLAAPEI